MRWVALALCGCAGPGRYADWTYTPPVAADDWPVAPASAYGIDESALTDAVRTLAEARFVQMRSILVSIDGDAVLELYDRPSRQVLRQDLRSTTKSFTALVIARLAEAGRVDLDAPIREWVDTPDTARWNATTLRHLLSMRSGLDCDDGDRDSAGFEEKMYRRRDWVAFWLGLPHVADPGSETVYCTGNLVAAGRVAEVATGATFDVLAGELLFDTAGVDDAVWERFPEGIDTGGHLHLTPRDLMRVGQHVLEVSDSDPAVLAVLEPYGELNGVPYGLAWRVDTVHAEDGRSLSLWYTSGNGGQHLFLMPELGLVTAFTGDAYNHPDASAPFAVMGQVILPLMGVQPVQAVHTTTPDR